MIASHSNREAAMPKADRGARQRLMAAAYDLFTRRGVNQVGIDTILAKSGCAKASLYHHFPSKVDLVLAFLEQRESRWTRGWLEEQIGLRSRTPAGRLLAIFDVFDEWFRRKDFEGCSFINVLLESEISGPVHRAAALHLAKIRTLVRGVALRAGLAEPAKFAAVWHMLMKGSIVAACEGNHNAAREAQRAGRLILDGWQRPTTQRSRLARRGARSRSS